jgi:alpha-tubulin suppressor-like RCC1 family protein
MKRKVTLLALSLAGAACSPSVETHPGSAFSQLEAHPLEHIASGFAHTCGITAGDVLCFGDDGEGQVPDFDPGGKTQVVEYDGTAAMGLLHLGDAVEVAAGVTHTCARRESGQVVCWGQSNTGALGGGGVPEQDPATWPTTVVGLDDAQQIALDASGVSGQTSCALKRDGTVACWGAVFGIPEQASEHATPVVLPEIAGATQIGIGNAFGCALLDDGGVSCWGYNFLGQLGDPALGTDAAVLANRVPGLESVARIAVSGEHVCAALTSGELYCWGRGDVGQLGDGYTGPLEGKHPHFSATPLPVALPGPVTALAASEQATCAHVADQVLCWGAVGTQDGTVTTVPIAIQDLDDAKEISTGVDFGCTVDAASRTRCWGDNTRGQLGVDNASPDAQFFATPIDLSLGH